MKSLTILILIISFWSLTNFGCKSNPIVPAINNGKPEITILPDSLHGVEYVDYVFKAKISNYDFAQTYFLWDMGDGSPIYRNDLSYQSTHSYSTPGSYTIKVNAYDIYTDSVIATKTENIIIDTVRPIVEIIPQFYIGTLKMDDFGNLQENLNLSAKLSNANANSTVRYYWDFGDGTKDSIDDNNNTYHHFSQPGVYIVKVDVYQYNGIYDCTDTAKITINYADVSLASLEQMGRVQAVLYLDNTYALTQITGYQNPLSIGVLFSNAIGYTSGWNGGNFSTHFHSETGLGTSNYELKDFLVSGSVSSDTKTINSINVSIEDTTTAGNVSTLAEYGFKADNAQLVAATPDEIIYKVSTSDLKNYLHDAYFTSYWKDISDCSGMDLDYLHIATSLPPPAQLLIVFSKQ